MGADRIDPRFIDFADSRDRALRDELVLDNRGLAVAFARRFRNRGIPDEDLEQVAHEALIRSVDRFRPEQGLRFSTFAARTIEGALKQYFRDGTWAVKVPRRTRQLVTALRAVTDDLVQRLGRMPTSAELARELQVDEADVTLALEAGSGYTAASLQLSGAELTAHGSDIERALDRVAGPQLLELLPDGDRRVVELRFFADMSQSEIAARIGVSQMQVSRILRRALAQLRAHVEPNNGP